MAKILIDRELLERISDPFTSTEYLLDGLKELRAILAAPRQPEGEAIKPVARVKEYTDVDGDIQHAVHWLGKKLPHGTELCRISDAQRAIAELREECERLGRTLYERNNELSACEAERDTLRQQLAERDAAIEEWSDTAVQNGMECDRLAAQRDKLLGLLADVKADYTHAIHWEDMHASMKRIDAALAEVNK